MLRYAFPLVDVSAAVLGTLIVFLMLEGELPSWSSSLQLVLYLLAVIAAALFGFVFLESSHSMTRLFGPIEPLRLALTVASTTFVVVVLASAYNGMGGIPKFVLALQILVPTMILIVFRSSVANALEVCVGKPSANQIQPSVVASSTSTLIVGRPRLVKAYLVARQELEDEPHRIAGILVPNRPFHRRTTFGLPILGCANQAAAVIAELEVHGVIVDRIVIAMRRSDLSSVDQISLSKVATNRGIQFDFLSELMGFRHSEAQSNSPVVDRAYQQVRAEPTSMDQTIGTEPSGHVLKIWKRGFDIVLALCLLVVLSPLLLLLAALVIWDVGLPLVFWQQRPGRGGHAFRLYKLRTMRAPFDSDGARLADVDRMSSIGQFLRRTHLDELPQIFNVLAGQMSFVGPRPLLPADQSDEYKARLLVRPGLTGWAQVQGVRDMAAADKAVLDIWYIRNASFALDLWILIKTIPVLIFGERSNPEAIQQSWTDVREAGLYKNDPSEDNMIRGAE